MLNIGVGVLGFAFAGCGSNDSKDSGKKSNVTDPDAPAASCSKTPTASLTDELFGHSQLDDDRALIETLVRQGSRPVSVRVVDAYRAGAGVDASHFELVEEVDGVPLCGPHAFAHVIGDTPSLPRFVDYVVPASAGEEAFGDPEALLAAAAVAIGEPPSTSKLRTATRCLQPVDFTLAPAYEIQASIGERPFLITGDRRGPYKIVPQSLHAAATASATATASVFKRNPYDKARVDVPLDVDADGYLHSHILKIVSSSGELTVPIAVDGKFTAAPNDKDFAATSLMAHAEEQIAYDMSFRATSADDCLPIEIQPHAKDGPVYLASWNQDTSHPRILVPDGDGVTLQNLALDYDAVAHELGHHFVYQHLKALDYQPSLVIHEGMADFFVYAHTGDTCLAESICPADSLACIVPGKCLRSGDFKVSNMKFYNELYEKAPFHQQSQALSGMLVAMGADASIGADAIAKIAFASIDFLKAKSDLSDFLVAILSGDQAAFGGTHACKIVEIAKDYGLKDETAAVDCKTFQKTP